MKQETIERVRAVMDEAIREIAELEDDEIVSDDQNLNENLGIDSLMGVDLIIVLERELNIVIPEAEVTKVVSVGQLFSLVSKMVSEKAET